MKLTFKQILNSVEAFRELQSLKLPPKTSLDIYKMGKELEREIRTHQDLRDKIFKSFGVPENETGFNLEGMDKDKVAELIKELQELGDTPVRVQDYAVDISVFERFDVPITAAMLTNLDWFIKDNEQPIANTAEPEEEEIAAEATN